MKNFDFVSNTKIFLIVSAALIVLGLAFVLFSGLNLGVDFAGGSQLYVNIGEDYDVEELRDIVSSQVDGSTVSTAGDNNQDAMIRLKASENEQEEQLNVINKIKERYDVDESQYSVDYVGATIGRELIVNALLSVLAACVLMLAYIWFRFELQSGVAAVIALIHDVLIIFTLVTIFKVQINSAFVAALLTIIGYSINDTIVVFDRIRENNRRFGNHMSKPDVVNKSINETIVRSINTSVTTLFAVTALYVLGVASVKEFAFPIMIGIISGTYSSIFIASPIWAKWTARLEKK